MIVYIVTAGEYSDYGIVSVFTDEEQANAYAKWYTFMYGGSNGVANVEEYETDTFDVNTPLDKRYYRVWMDKNGNDARAYITGIPLRDVSVDSSVIFDHFHKKELFTTEVMAKDDIHAIKIANERRGRFIAEGKWSVE